MKKVVTIVGMYIRSSGSDRVGYVTKFLIILVRNASDHIRNDNDHDGHI